MVVLQGAAILSPSDLGKTDASFGWLYVYGVVGSRHRVHDVARKVSLA
jgi:hypothetical protein